MDTLTLTEPWILRPGEVIDFAGSVIDAQSWPIITQGDATIANGRFINAPLVAGRDSGRFIKHESTGLLSLVNSTFEGAEDEAVLVSNYDGRSVNAHLLAVRCAFLDNSRNLMVALLDDERWSDAELSAVMKQCYFRGGFRNPLLRGCIATMWNCFWEDGGYPLFLPPSLGTHPFTPAHLPEDQHRAAHLWHRDCHGIKPPVFERNARRGSSHEIGLGYWPSWAGTTGRVLSPSEIVERAQPVSPPPPPPEDRPPMPYEVPYTITAEVKVELERASEARFRPGIYRFADPGPLRMAPGAAWAGDQGACLDGERTQLQAIEMADGSSIVDLELKNFVPTPQRAVIEMRRFTVLTQLNGWYEPAAVTDLTTGASCTNVYVHDSSGYAFVIANDSSLIDCRAENMGQGGYTSHGGVGGRITNGVWKNFNLAGVNDPYNEAGNKIKYHLGLVIEGGAYSNINGTGIWFDIQNADCTVSGALVAECTGPGIQFELSNVGVCYSDRCWVKRCGRDGSNWLNNSGFQVYNATAVITNFVSQDNYNGLGALQDARTVKVAPDEWEPARTNATFRGGLVVDSGQSGWVGPVERADFADIRWRLGLSVTPNEYDEWRRENPFRIGDSAADWEGWRQRFAGQELVVA